MNRAGKYILSGFLLMGAVDLSFAATASETASNELITRPVVEYKSSQLRDPFMTYLIKEEPLPAATLPETATTTVAGPGLDVSRFRVQGIIWGAKVPQAIINNKVLTIGDLIDGAEILSIEKKGITVSFNGAVYSLNSPGQTPAHAE